MHLLGKPQCYRHPLALSLQPIIPHVACSVWLLPSDPQSWKLTARADGLLKATLNAAQGLDLGM